jgi:transposase-like protein
MDKEALRGFVGMIHLALEKIEELIEESEQAPICVHPIQARMDMSTMGHAAWRCKLCGFTYEQAEDSGDGEIRTE